MSKKVGIEQIAQELGVAPSTVSRALKGDSRISASTSKRVLDSAAAHDYIPQCGRERIVALMLTRLSGGTYQSNLLHEIEKQAAKHKLRLEVVLPDAMHSFERHYWFGMIAIGFFTPQLKDIADRFQRPIVTINQPGIADSAVYGVVSDDCQIFRESFDILTAAGHKKIGFLAAFHPNCVESYNFRCRVNAYRSECKKRRLKRFEVPLPLATGDICGSIQSLYDTGVTALISLLPSSADPIEYYFSKLPIQVPEELSVINWEGSPRSEWFNISQQFSKLADASFTSLEKLAEKQELPLTQSIRYILRPGKSIATPRK